MKTLPKTDIEYLTHHYPAVTGCSLGCPYCWARGNVEVLHRTACHGWDAQGSIETGPTGLEPRPFCKPLMHPDRLDLPLKHKKPARIGVCFSGDLFGPEVPHGFQQQVFQQMMFAHWHQFFILTKQAEIMQRALGGMGWIRPPMPTTNVHLGVTVTTQAEADERIPLLLATPAAKRWVSIEPMLGPIGLHPYISYRHECGKGPALDFIVVGSIDRPSAQFPAPRREWINAIRGQCAAAGVPLWEKNNLARHGIVKDRPLVQELP